MLKHLYLFYIILISLFVQECSHKHYCTTSDNIQKEHIVIQQQPIDSSIYKHILPYKTKLDKDLNIIIANTDFPLEKDKTCNNLAQLVFESMKFYADSFVNQNYFILINYGGLRANLPKGNITKRNIFELMPFDNSIVILELNDNQLNELLQKSQSNSKLLVKSTYPNHTSHILVTSDYLYQGGDDCTFLKSAKKLNNKTIFIRDAIIQYCQHQKKLNISCFHQK
ncbi:MAG: hypothetical protein KatS3mg027_2087 [Bacteroidia bacterium]|nr:MAG: hypothetical protein KatS3mg027_2087 [Bacteroidia bacterium]